MKRIILFIGLFLIVPNLAFAADIPEYSAEDTWLDLPINFFLGVALLLFGALVIFAEIFLLAKKGVAFGENSIKIIGLTIIVIIAAFLITAGYSAEQIAPGIGLFGTIAGYLLSQSEK